MKAETKFLALAAVLVALPFVYRTDRWAACCLAIVVILVVFALARQLRS